MKPEEPSVREQPRGFILSVESAVTLAGKPFVIVRCGDATGQLSPEECRYQAQVFLEAAEAAEQDAFLVSWVRETGGDDPESIAALIKNFRAFREERRDCKRP